jgi:hypothetical protein
MEINYLKEAFQRLSLLEDDFNLSADAGVVDELKSFVADDIEAPEEEAIIDVEAETEDDLKDSYIGKVILECDCCHARIYKDIADVIIDDETGLANIEERCPVCSTESGFNVIGKIEEFNQDELKDQPKDEDEPEENVEDDIEDEDEEEFTVEESFKSALNKVLTENKHGCTTKGCDDDIELETEEVTEAVNPIMDRIRKKMLAANSLDENVEEDEVFEDPNAVEDDIQVHEAKADKLNKLHAKMAALPEGCELKEENSIMNNLRKKMMSLATDESLTEDLKEVEVKTDAGQVKVKNGFDDKVTVDFSSDAGEADEGEMIVPLNDEDIDNIEDNDEENIDDLDLEEPIEEPTEEEPLEEPIEGEEETEEATEESEEEDEEANESYKLTNEKYNSLNESKVNRYKLTNESYGWPMDLDDADPEDRERYLNSGEPVEIDDPNEDPYFDTLSDIDDFDEETFDELGEAYLRKVYENVDSFITESVASQNGKLTIEGLITFTSGNKKHTSFIFESAQRTKRGKVVLEGMNKTFSNSAKAFSLKGELNNKQFVSESMIYNYNTKILNESNEAETAKVYGRVIVKK